MPSPSESAAVRASHPRGLYVLFLTEMWERYSFYSMMAILTLYMDEALMFPTEKSGQIYGGYIGGVYLMPLFGGWLADRVLGFNKAVIIGGVLMMAGHFALAFEQLPFFYSALVLLACGSGLLKPNVSTIVGNLYRDQPALRDAGFNIFYMGINIGAFLSPLSVAWLRANYGWSVAFGSAGVAMGLSLLTFILGNKHIAHAAKRVDEAGAREEAEVTDGGRRIAALLVIFVIVIAFWVAFFQNGFTLTFWARDNTETSLSPELFQSVEPLCIIAFTPLLVGLWARLRSRGAEPTTVSKMLIGMVLTALSFAVMVMAGLIGGDTGRVSASWLVASYAIIALGEICLSPMGLSLVTKVAPPRQRGLMMGAWFVVLSAGGYFSGVLGAYWDRLPHSQFFALVTGFTLVAAALLVMARRALGETLRAAGADE